MVLGRVVRAGLLGSPGGSPASGEKGGGDDGIIWKALIYGVPVIKAFRFFFIRFGVFPVFSWCPVLSRKVIGRLRLRHRIGGWSL